MTSLFSNINNNQNRPNTSAFRNFLSRVRVGFDPLKTTGQIGPRLAPKPTAPTQSPAPTAQPAPQQQPSNITSNPSGTNPAIKTPAAQQYIGSQMGGNASTLRPSAPQPSPTTPNAPANALQNTPANAPQMEPVAPVKTPKDKYLEFLNSDKVKQAGETVDDFTKRTAEEISRNRKAEEGIEANDIGALSSGVNARLTDEARKSNKSLADIALAKGYATDIYNRMLSEGKDQYEAEQEAYKAVEQANKPISISEAAELGVPYGTTYAGLAKMGITPALASEGFSLSEGQARYDAQGNLIAARAKTYSPSESGGGFSPAQINSTVNSIAGAFDNEPIVKQFNVLNEGYQFAKNLSNDTQNPSDDQGLIYAFAKAMDPNSVVREGEYATVQKYAQSLAKSYGRSINQAINGTGFLSADARANIKKTIESKYATSKANYDNVYKQYQKRIQDAQAGKGNSLTDYSAYGSDNSQNSGASKFEYLAPQITIKGKNSYLPRSVWASLSGADKDALLAEAQTDGYPLLIQ